MSAVGCPGDRGQQRGHEPQWRHERGRIYFVSANECHLWEDPAAPLFIRTETGPSVKSLGIDLVVYGCFAYTHARYSQAQKINGTGLVTPVFA